MTISSPKADLHTYLRGAREALLWKLDGLSEYDARRPLVPTGTNLLGLVKHAALVEVGYFGDTFGRPLVDSPPWLDSDDPLADLWATADESRADILGLYERVCAHADATIEELELDGVGQVPWWPEDRRQVTLHQVLVHVIADLQRHAGHADIVRELIDGAVGLRASSTNLPTTDPDQWRAHRDRVEAAARAAGS